jgi:hypothetical protein
MEPEGSWPCLQNPAIELYSEPADGRVQTLYEALPRRKGRHR